MGVMARARSGEVRHSRSISSRSRRRMSACSDAPCRGSSRSVSRSAIRRSAVATARRRASVGCAVSTGCTRSRPSSSSSWAGPWSRRELADRGGQRLTYRRVARVPLPQGPDPVQFLGQVGQVEVDGERPGHQLGPVQRPAGHQRRDLVPGRVRVRARAQPGIRAAGLPTAGVDNRVPQPLGVVQQLLAAGFAQHLAQQAAEQPHVAAQRRGQLLPVGVPGRGGSGRGRGILAHRASLVALCVGPVNPRRPPPGTPKHDPARATLSA